MQTEILAVSPILAELRDMLRSFGVPPESLVLVASVQEWSREQGLQEGDSMRIARAIWGGRFGMGTIALLGTLRADHLRSAQQGSTLHALTAEEERWLLASPSRLVRHALLREVAHLRGIPAVGAANRWALQQLRALATP